MASITATATKTSNRFSLTTLPPFPDDVPTAPLLRLSLAKLAAGDVEERTRFVQACEDLGFFYLDLSAPNAGADPDFVGERIMRDADELFNVTEDLFELPMTEKSKYDFIHKKSYFGYKGIGANLADKEGNRDRNEFYNVSKDDIFGISEKLPAPDVLENRRDLIKSFMTSAHSIVSLVLRILNEHLRLPSGTLENLHRLKGNSGDQVRFLKAPPQPMDDRKIALGEHTDFGSVTVLFNRIGGLQILPPGKDAQWCYVKPLPDHAIINLGDAMVKFTNGLLRSNIHRVFSPPGQQADSTRYSLVYFSRPENQVLMKRLEGSDKIPALKPGETEEDITSTDWIIRRALGYRLAAQGKGPIDLDRYQGTEAMSKRDA